MQTLTKSYHVQQKLTLSRTLRTLPVFLSLLWSGSVHIEISSATRKLRQSELVRTRWSSPPSSRSSSLNHSPALLDVIDKRVFLERWLVKNEKEISWNLNVYQMNAIIIYHFLKRFWFLVRNWHFFLKHGGTNRLHNEW